VAPTLQGSVAAVCASSEKHVAKDEVGEAVVRQDHGLEGDAHAGPGHRQVSLIDKAQVDAVREKVGQVAAGAFGENFVVDGIDLLQVGMGTRLRLGGDVLIEISQIGKVCHDRCAIFQTVGECPMSDEGVFGRVLRGGTVRRGDAVRVENLVDRRTPQAAVVVVSDRCFRGETRDTAGEAVAALLEGGGIHIFDKVIVPDEQDEIRKALVHLCDERHADLVFTAGGTGMAPRDVTPEATAGVIDRPVPGLSEAMRMAAFGRVPKAVLSRGLSGMRGRSLIVNLPGSEKGASESIEILLPVLHHAVKMARGSVTDCGR
jgi:molybdopterin adenylyltransferase